MEIITYVVEAAALIEGIHVLKQWIYDGTAQLLVPICTSIAVEEAYKLSITPKDPPKQQTSRHSGRSARKEHPLFDINPRTAWEFIIRAGSEKGIEGVTFQKENEVFTQWREEEERAVKAETPLPPPSSFADALLRKLAIAEEKESVKTPSKPKLTARTKESKPAWKIDRVPIISSASVEESDKSLLSCMLWRTYEIERNPLQPVKYVLLANKQEIKDKAVASGLAISTIPQVQKQFLTRYKEHDERNFSGELEQQFPEILAMSQALGPSSPDHLETGPADFGFLDSHDAKSAALESHAEMQHGKHKSEVMRLPHKSAVLGLDTTPAPIDLGNQPIQDGEKALSLMSENDTIIKDGEVTSIVPTVSTMDDRDVEISQNVVRSNPSPVLTTEKHASVNKDHKASHSESELESDEEIIVFNPRNKRTSGLGGSSSRPNSSGGFIGKTYKAGIQTESRPTSSKGLISLDGQIELMLKSKDDTMVSNDTLESSIQSDFSEHSIEPSLKAPIESKLKAQSPVFTPGQPFNPSPLGISASTGELHIPVLGIKDSISPPTGPRQQSARIQRVTTPQRDHGQELLRIQKENSQRIIQRQREAIQRQSKTVETHTKPVEPASPRLVTMEPTDKPTIIDPDAFDRSYVVQAPSKQAPYQNGDKRRSKGHRHSPKVSPKRLPEIHPKDNGPVVEPDVDYVLKSGAPRGSTRGRGKLWIP